MLTSTNLAYIDLIKKIKTIKHYEHEYQAIGSVLRTKWFISVQLKESLYFSDVIWESWGLKLPATLLFVQSLIQANNKANLKCPPYRPLGGVNSPHKDQQCGKGFHVVASTPGRHCVTQHIESRNKMADISQTTFLKAISWIKIYEFRLIFRWISN